MKWLVFFALLSIFWVRENVQSANDYLQLDSYRTLMSAIQVASHDASLQVEATSIGNGDIVFNQSEADAAFRQTLADNLRLNPTTLQPLQNSMFKQAPVIRLEQFFDYSNTSFPYHYVNSALGIDVVMNGPSIVYDLQAEVPATGNYPTYNISWPVVVAYPDY